MAKIIPQMAPDGAQAFILEAETEDEQRIMDQMREGKWTMRRLNGPQVWYTATGTATDVVWWTL